MPKRKTNRLASKKILLRAKGKAKRAHSSTGHNTGKRSSKRNRQLRGRTGFDSTHEYHILRLLPNKN